MRSRRGYVVALTLRPEEARIRPYSVWHTWSNHLTQRRLRRDLDASFIIGSGALVNDQRELPHALLHHVLRSQA